MREKHVATIDISLPSSDLAETIYLSLKPESDAKAKITIEDNVVTLSLKADSVATLRALFNSYLRWVATIKNTIDAANTHSHTTN